MCDGLKALSIFTDNSIDNIVINRNSIQESLKMNVDHLQLFVRVAVTHNISLAGRELGLSAAVSSAYINKLEQGLGVRLIHRTTRSVALTEEGAAFLPHAESVLESIESARASVGAGSIQPQGRLRVAASASFGRMHLIPRLAEFIRQYPELQVDIHLSDSIVDMVEGGFDIAVRDAKLNDSSLIARRLAPVERVICASPDYLERFGEPETPQQLQDHFCVSLMGLESWLFETPEGDVSVKVKSRIRTDNGEAARDACINGMGITQSSDWCCYQQIQSGELVQILKDYPLANQPSIWALYPSSRLLAPKVRAFIDYFAQRFGDEPEWRAMFKVSSNGYL